MVWRVGWAPNIELQGLVVAWPVAVVGIAGFRPRDGAARPLAVLLIVFAGLVVFTQYAEGGGFEWGGRFLSPMVGPMAAMAAVGLLRLRPHPMIKGAVATIVVVPVVAGMMMLTRVRSDEDAVAVQLSALAPNGIVATDIHYVTQYLWDQEVTDRMLTAPPGQLPELFVQLRRAGLSDVTVLTGVGSPSGQWGRVRVEVIPSATLEAQGQELLRVHLS
jgi:hypothetical protein